MKKSKPEAAFELELAYCCNIKGWRYFKIPDTNSIDETNRTTHNELKRPCDAFIAAPGGILIVEAKYMYSKLSEHQERNGITITEINGMFCVPRKIRRANETVYVIENVYGKRLGEFQNCQLLLDGIKKEFNL